MLADGLESAVEEGRRSGDESDSGEGKRLELRGGLVRMCAGAVDSIEQLEVLQVVLCGMQ